MFATALADVLRAEGLNVVEVPGWKTRSTVRGGLVAVKAIFLHHTAGPSTGNYPSFNTVLHGRPDVAGPLAQLGLGRDGTVYVFAAGVAWHSGAGRGYGLPTNAAAAYALGIEAESTGRGDWTAAQLNVYPRMVAALARHYKVPLSRVIGHKEWAPGRKIDPFGWPGDMYGFRKSVANLLGIRHRAVSAKTRTTIAAIAAALALTVGSILAVNPGLTGGTPVERGQTIEVPSGADIERRDPVAPAPRNSAAPHVNDQAPVTPAPSERVRDQQRALNKLGYRLEVDGIRGPKTIAATRDVQDRCNIKVDGIYGPDTTACVNRLIAKQNDGPPATPPANPTPPAPDKPVLVRGSHGARVVTLQKHLNKLGYHLRVDGDYGPRTEAAVRDFQARAGLGVDGDAGPITHAAITKWLSPVTLTSPVKYGERGVDVKHVQARVGAAIDGVYGPRTYAKLTAWQRAHGLVADGIVGPRTARALGWTYR